MKRVVFLMLVLCLGTALVILAADKKTEKIDRAAATPTVQVEVESQESATPAAPAPSAKLAGEEINWQVISGGGNMNGTSANYILSGTIGQTAVGEGASASNDIYHGFWQVFTSGNCCDTPGDANNDGSCNIGDVVYLNNYVFKSSQCLTNPPVGCPPECMPEGDANADGSVNIGDAVFIVNFVFRPPPASPYPVCGP